MYYYVIEKRAPNKGFRYKVYLYYDDPMGNTTDLGSQLAMTKWGARWWAKRTARKLDKFGHKDKAVEQQVISIPHA